MTLFVIQGSEGRKRSPLPPGVRFPATLTLSSRGRRLDVSSPAMVSIELTTRQEESHTYPTSDSVARLGPATGSAWPRCTLSHPTHSGCPALITGLTK